MKTVASIEARMTSSRLPGKVLLPIMGKPMLELLVERLKKSKLLDEIVVATTTNKTDDPIEQLSRNLGVGCFRGSEDDVLCRVIGAAHAYKTDVIVEITGDCPLIDPRTLDKVIEAYHSRNVDYVSNVLERTYPRGMETQVFSTAVLEKVAKLTQDPIDHEHVSLYVYEHPEIFRLYNVRSDLPEEFWDIRLTVDTQEDFQLIRTIYETLYPENPDFSLYDIIDLLKNRRELLEINRNINQKKVR